MKERGINSVYVFILIFFLFSCKEEIKVKDDSEISYRYFKLENAGWKSRETNQTIDNINYKATEVPLPYYILKTLGNEDLAAVDSIQKANSKERIFEFELSEETGKDLLEKKYTNLDYSKGVEYLSFKIEKDFYVVTSKDTVPCSGVTFERNFKVAPHHKLLLFFTNIAPDEKVQLVYKDNLFGKGAVKFKFKENITKLLL